MPKKLSNHRPESVKTAADRGQMLRHLISLTGKGTSTFAAEAGLPRSTLGALLDGSNDVTAAEKKTAQTLLRALGMKSEEVVAALGIPPESQSRWADPNTATVEHLRRLRSWRLTQPLMGEVVFPSETVIVIDEANTEYGILVTKLRTGELFAMKAGALAQSSGEVMGQLVSADFSAVLPVSAPS